jgi:hypothetical protein
MGGAALFLVQSERKIRARESRLSAFEHQARAVSETLARVRSAQQAYVAEGQGKAFWISEVGTLVETSAAGIESLYESTASAETQPILDSAKSQLTTFTGVDARAREYLKSYQVLMAADVVFTEGGEAASEAAKQIQAAIAVEKQTFALFEAGQHRLQAIVLMGVGLFAGLVVTLLAVLRHEESPHEATEPIALEIAPAAPQVAHHSDPSWNAAAEICTGFGKSASPEALTAALAHAAIALHARGLIVWVGDESGADLRPVLAHGYSSQVLAHMPAIPRSADNAAAAAYRTGLTQVVAADRVGGTGALVSPILTPAGCIGALTAEVAGGEERSDSRRALAAIFAAQLSTMVTPASPADSQTKTATA